MKTKTIWNERFGMLMASGSPGSALAYQLGNSLSGSGYDASQYNDGQDHGSCRGTGQARGPDGRLRGWVGLFDRFEAWTYAREMREIEAYLAQAQNHADLEARMRHLHDDLLSRARSLR